MPPKFPDLPNPIEVLPGLEDIGNIVPDGLSPKSASNLQLAPADMALLAVSIFIGVNLAIVGAAISFVGTKAVSESMKKK